MGAYLIGLVRYFDVGGRSSRSQYWLFHLCFTIVLLLAFSADVWIARNAPSAGIMPGAILIGAVLFHFAPAFSIGIRRLHDIGKSGLWYLICLIPFGGLLIFVWSFFPSEEGENQWGDDPTRIRPPRDTPPPMRGRPMGRTSRSGDFAQQTLAGIQARRARPDNRFV